MLTTAYDYPTAQGGKPSLVGQFARTGAPRSNSTVRVTMTEMLHHTKAVVRGTQRALVVGDMPFLTYGSVDEALENAGGSSRGRLPGGQGRGRRPLRADHRGPGEGRHPGHGPHRLDAPGPARDGRQGPCPGQGPHPGPRPARRAPSPVQEAGAFSIVLELVPAQLAAAITERLRIPRSASGPAPDAAARSRSSRTCSASADFLPRHARPYAHLRATIAEAAHAYADDVAAGTFPGDAESVRMDDAVLDEALGRGASDRPIDATSGDRDIPAGGIPLDRDL